MCAAISSSKPQQRRAVPWDERTDQLPRAEGRLNIRFARRDRLTVLDHLYQRGSAKARFPKVFDGGPPEAVLINLAGGVTGADRFDQVIDFADGTHAVVTTQAAEKIYRASRGSAPAHIKNAVTVGADALAEWLPQETIFFDGGRLARRFEAKLAPTARLLANETIIFGRTAMGETVHEGFLNDVWRIAIDDRIIFADALRLDGAVQERLDRPAVAHGGRALATVLYVGPDSESLIVAARNAVAPFRTAEKRAAVSRIDKLIVARLIATDGSSLRVMLDTYLSTIRHAAGELPKLWRC